MKTITITNWILIGLYGLLVVYTLMNVNRSGNDAAGRGMETGFAFLGAFILAALFGLNLLPYRALKIIILIVLALPLLIIVYNIISNYFTMQEQNRAEEARSNGSFFFDDQPRREIAAAIATSDTIRLQALLQKPVPQLNECGYQNTTLLDFAAQKAVEVNASTSSLRCMEMLLEKGATIQGPDSVHTPTHILICQTGSVALLEWFLKKGADPNAQAYESSPILFEVMQYDKDRLEKVKLLLNYGADPDALSASTGYAIKPLYTPLMYAAFEQLWDVCHLLLERGADPDYRTPQGDDLPKVMKMHEELYADVNDIPATFTSFKNYLETNSAGKL
ncbi:ankyrin repeat domain-containing protein [Larkinella sp. VNQ87]|uniref:ankyrin repeat domain-containing protein n=1 Tax=Larkinella sp. VNQ87 TaxID=3400921 RepID=UPI003C0E27EC